MRAAATVRAGVAVAELAGPDRWPVSRLWDHPIDDRMRLAARVLGVRDAVSAGVLASGSGGRVRLGIAMIDSLHAASMIALASASKRYRRPALVSCMTATALAIATLGLSTRAARASTGSTLTIA